MSILEHINEIRKGGSVHRYHIQRMHRYQTVADHSWGVMAILLDICEPSPNLIKAALYHDVAEYWTGDIPATAKWASKDLTKILSEIEERIEMDLGIKQNLTAEETRMLKIADLLELTIHCHEELTMGNNTVLYVIHNGLNALRHIVLVSDKAFEVLQELINIYQGESNHG